MSRYNCYLCASDEGILLDIFGDAGKPFREYIETCLSVKEDAPSTKICHKCAYELESCKKFLVKYKCFREADKEHASSKRRGHCRLCGETPQKLRLLLVRKGNSLKNLLHKLQQVFLDNSLKEDITSLSVCLDCRYNLDVLSDLKIIHHESVKKLRNVNENGLKLSDLPKVFRELELPSELERLRQLRGSLYDRRRQFIGRILNNTDVLNLESLMRYELRAYEHVVEEATQGGLFASLLDDSDTLGFENGTVTITTERWSVIQAVFFASTVLTTIGYGNVVPTTSWGRLFCIVFAFGGIPLTLTVIADWGKLFAEAVSSIASRIGSKLPDATTSWIPSNHAGRRSLGAFAAALLLFLYLACGAGMFMLWEDDWGFFDGFYFCFVTMTTIGFGDLVPKKPKYMLLCTLYILIGLALTGTIIELVRRRYAQSWRRLQALSGPFAESLRRLGEHAGGDMSAFHSDLRKVLTVVSMPRLKRTLSGRTQVKDTEWEEAVEAVLRDIASASSSSSSTSRPIVQIVVYESSV